MNSLDNVQPPRFSACTKWLKRLTNLVRIKAYLEGNVVTLRVSIGITSPDTVSDAISDPALDVVGTLLGHCRDFVWICAVPRPRRPPTGLEVWSIFGPSHQEERGDSSPACAFRADI